MLFYGPVNSKGFLVSGPPVRNARIQPIAWASILSGLCTVSLAATEADLQLVEAAKNQNWETVSTLLDQRVDVNTAQADGATALHWAAFWNNLDAVKLLVNTGANVDVQNDYGATPLWCACASRHTGIVEQLLASDANPNLGLRSGESILMRCVHTGDASAVRALARNGANVSFREPSRGQTALMWSAATAHPEITRVLLEYGAPVDVRTTTLRHLQGSGMQSTTSPAGAEFFNAGGFTPLLFAASSGDGESARLLLDAGANLHETAADGNSALVVATMSGHGRLAKFLVDRGADLNADGAGYTALHAAVLWSRPELVTALLTSGANPNARLVRGTPIPRYTFDYVFTHKEKGATPFLLAAKYLEPEIMRILSAGGADPLVTFEDGTTALMAAAGLRVNRYTTRRNRTLAPELVATKWKKEAPVLDSIRVAIEAGAVPTINVANRAGDTALHGAARDGFKTVVEFLVDHGGDLNIENKKGMTPRTILERRAKSAGNPSGD